MKLPIIVVEPGDIAIFETIADAESYLESPDVLANRYVAYDSEGRLLRLVAVKPNRISEGGLISVGPVRVFDTESNHVDELRRVLIAFLTRLGELETDLSRLSLGALLEKSIGRLGYTH